MPAIRLHRCWLAIAILLLLIVPGASQQAPSAALLALETDQSRQFDQIEDSLGQIASTLRRDNLSEQRLQALQARIAPLGIQLTTELTHLNEYLAAVKMRLDQLGPPPDKTHPPESREVTMERLAQQKDYAAIDALVKRAKLLAVRDQQIAAWIAKRQQESFTEPLLTREQSIVDPHFWIDVAEETPHTVKIAQGAIGDFISAINHKLAGWREPAFWASLCLIVILYAPLVSFARRRLMRESDEFKPGRLRKSLSAWWSAGVVVGCALLIALAVAGHFAAYGVLDASTQPVLWAVFIAVFKVAAAAGLARGLLAPTHANWRLVKLDTQSCRYAYATIIEVTIVVAVTRLLISFAQAIGTDGLYRAALQALAATLVAGLITLVLWRDRKTECELGEVLGPRVTSSTARDWYGLIRILLWIAVAILVVAVVAGFMGLANFVAEQIVWVGLVAFVTVMSIIFVGQAIAHGCRPASPFGQAVVASIGLRRDSLDQLAVLLSGAATVTIFITAVLIILAPLGIQSTDLPTYLHSAFFGFHVGDIRISLASIIIAIGIFFAGTTASRTVERWLDVRFLPLTHLDIGLRNAIKTSVGYLGFVLALSFALAYLGVNFEKLAIVAGALSVGIGFGLQSIVNNFVSGLIILWERAIRVGDWIVVGSDEGLVRRINIRSTEIETFDRAAVMVPNSNLVAGVVKNYVRTDRTGRLQIGIPVNPAADPQVARNILIEIARGHRLVLKDPAPFANFTSITASAFNFDLFCFVADVSTLGSVKSDLNFEIYRRFKTEGLFAGPPPQSIVTLAGLEKFEPLLNKVVGSMNGQGTGNGREPPG